MKGFTKLLALVLACLMTVSVFVACGGGDVLVITVLQAEGGKRMPAPDYFRGHPLDVE